MWTAARILILFVGFSIAPAGRLWAQTEAPAFAVGPGYTLTWYPEANRHAFGLGGNVRVPISGRVSLEPHLEFGYLKKTQVTPAGTRTADTRHLWTLGANFLVSKRSGQFRPYGGGGAGVWKERRTSEVAIDQGPSPGVHRFIRSSGLQLTGGGVAGLDVQVARSVAIFAEMRVDALAVSGGALNFWYLTGVRIPLR